MLQPALTQHFSAQQKKLQFASEVFAFVRKATLLDVHLVLCKLGDTNKDVGCSLMFAFNVYRYGTACSRRELSDFSLNCQGLVNGRGPLEGRCEVVPPVFALRGFTGKGGASHRYRKPM